MSSTPTAIADPVRLAALQRTALMDTPAEEAFDRVTHVAMVALRVPTVLVSLVDGRRQFFKSCVGLPEPWLSRRETPLSHSFCQHVVASGRPLVIDDAREHDLVRDNLAIQDLGVIAYAGMPITTADGHTLGTLCLIDSRPRKWTPQELSVLRNLCAFVVTEIEYRDCRRKLRGGQ